MRETSKGKKFTCLQDELKVIVANQDSICQSCMKLGVQYVAMELTQHWHTPRVTY